MKTAMASEPGRGLVPASRPVMGIAFLIASSWALSALDASGKWLMGAGVSLVVLCWVRYLVHLILVCLLVVPVKGRKVFHSVRPVAQVQRGLIMLLATLSFFTTLQYLPQAEATAINFLAPLIMLALAPWLLNEPPKMSRWLAAGAGFLGVLIIIRPDAGLHPVGTLLGLLTACVFAGQYLATRRVALDDPFTTLIWSGAVGTLGLTLALMFAVPEAWQILQALSGWHWFILLATGFWGAAGHLMQIQAYRCAPASLLAPFLYLQIISASTLGWLIWGQFPDPLTWLGIAVICASGVTIGVIEWRGRKL